MVDNPESLIAFTEESRDHLSDGQLFELAKGNILPWLENVVEDKIVENASLFYVEGNTFLSPGLILLDEFWASVADRFPNDVIIAIPRRDQLFLFRADAPNALTRARRLVEVTFEDEFNLLTPVLLIRRGGKIQLLEE